MLGVTLVVAAAVILLNLAVDLVLLVVDPRISRGAERAAIRGSVGTAA